MNNFSNRVNLILCTIYNFILLNTFKVELQYLVFELFKIFLPCLNFKNALKTFTFKSLEEILKTTKKPVVTL